MARPGEVASASVVRREVALEAVASETSDLANEGGLSWVYHRFIIGLSMKIVGLWMKLMNGFTILIMNYHWEWFIIMIENDDKSRVIFMNYPF